MQRLSFTHDDAVTALADQITSFVAAAEAFDDLELLDPSRCRGWSRMDLVVHVRCGLQEMALGAAARSQSEADTDAASYWRVHPGADDTDPVDGILWLRRVAGAHTRPTRAVQHLKDVALGTIATIRTTSPGVVEFQGRRMDSGDFLGTWVVELAVHQLDLDAAGPPPPGTAWTRRTIEALAGTRLPEELGDLDAVLAGLGRTGADHELGAAFPITL